MSDLALMALGLGLASSSALLVGAVGGLLADWPERLVAAVMAFGAGALISALAGLVAAGRGEGTFWFVAGGFLAGSLIFIGANHAINARGGFLRKPATLYRYLRERRRRHGVVILERLSRIELFRLLPPEEIQALVPFVEECRYRAGQTIFSPGDPGDALYLVETGTVEIRRSDRGQAGAEGPDVIPFGPGEAFGEMAMLAGQPHRHAAVARSEVRLWRLRQDWLERLEARSPQLAGAVEALRARHLADPRGSSPPDAPDAEDWHAAAVRHLDRGLAATTGLTDAEHHAQVQAHAGASSAPVAIFLGALLDGIPESVVIGASLLSPTTISYVFIVAVFLSNIPEALASAAGMRHYGYRPARVLGLWGALVVCSGLAAFCGNAFLRGAPEWTTAAVEALAAGGILAMLVDTMIPEAFEKGGPLVALWTALGFLAALFVDSSAAP